MPLLLWLRLSGIDPVSRETLLSDGIWELSCWRHRWSFASSGSVLLFSNAVRPGLGKSVLGTAQSCFTVRPPLGWKGVGVGVCGAEEGKHFSIRADFEMEFLEHDSS